MFRPGTLLVQFHLTSLWVEDYLILFLTPWILSVPSYCLSWVETDLLFLGFFQFHRTVYPWLRYLFYNYWALSVFLTVYYSLRLASALRTCTLNTLLWVEFCLVTRAWNPVFRPGTRSRKFCSSSIIESSFISFSVISLDIYQCLCWAFSSVRLLHF